VIRPFLAGTAGIVLVLAGFAAVPASTAEARVSSSLQVAPLILQDCVGQTTVHHCYVGGQAMRFTGYSGMRGRHKVHLQSNMSPGTPSWIDVPGSTRTTNRKGRFSFVYRAPAMFNIEMRVVGHGAATPAWRSKAQSQDLTITTPAAVDPGATFDIPVDTVPFLARPDTPPPVFPDRTVLLQQRDAGGRWVDVPGPAGVATTDDKGQATFKGVSVADASAPTVTYRAVEQNYSTRAAGRIGAYPSFPSTIRVNGAGPAAPSAPAAATSPPSTGPTLRTAHGQTAAKTYLWGRSLWDFAWEYGEPLDTRPSRGTEFRQSWPTSWVETSDGTGRVAQRNGQLSIDSGYSEGSGKRPLQAPHFGTTRATLADHAMSEGRWEVKLRPILFANHNSSLGDYHARVDLVPADDPQACSGPHITVADLDLGRSTMTYGSQTARGQWAATRPLKVTSSINAAVEVSTGATSGTPHVTWFVDGHPIGTVRKTAAVPGVPLMLRLSLVGEGSKAMNQTILYSDWQRAWSLNGGRQTTTATRVPAGTLGGSC